MSDVAWWTSSVWSFRSVFHSAFFNLRSRRDARELLPPRHQGLGHRLLLHAGGHHHARHHPGVRVGCKCHDTHTKNQPIYARALLFTDVHFCRKSTGRSTSPRPNTASSTSRASSALSTCSRLSGAPASCSRYGRSTTRRSSPSLLCLYSSISVRLSSRCNANAALRSVGKLSVEPSQPLGGLPPRDDDVSRACYYLRHMLIKTKWGKKKKLVMCVSAQIPDEILLHLSAWLLVPRTSRTLLPKDKEGKCVHPVSPPCFCCIVSRMIFYPPSKTLSITRLL